jgi:hypothetical protein
MRVEMRYLAVLLFLIISISILCSAELPSPGEMRAKAAKFAGRLLCIADLLKAPAMLLLITIGGINYLRSDDASDMASAKNLVINALIGGACMIALVQFATSVGVPPVCD